MDGVLLGYASVLGIITHLVFHQFEPDGLTVPICVLLIEPGALLYALSSVSNTLTLWTIAAVYALFFLSLALSITFYRLSPFHPLAQFPGPAIYKVTKLWGIWIQWQGHQHLVFKELHDKYGPFVRTGPNELSMIDLDAITSVLGPAGLPKGPFYAARRGPTTAPSSLLLLNKQEHVDRRRLWSRGMSSKSIKEYEVFIAKRGQQFQSRLADLSGTVNLAAWISFFTFDFLGDMAFGGGFETLRDGGDSSGIWSLIESSLDVLGLLSHIPWASMAVQRTPFLSHRLKSMRQFGADRAMDRLQTGASVKDLWYHLTDEAGLERTKPPIANVVADGFLAIIAGADTTATAMTCFFYLLLKHPDVYKRLQAEIDTVFPIGENPLDTSKHSNMPYLTACLNETLRIYPTVPVSGRRIVPLGGGKTIAGRFIPEGTQIYVPPYIYHRDPRYFSPSPDKFWPERWSNESAKPESFVHNATAFIPFSYGPANCVGQALAKREMMMVVSLLLQKFDMRFEEGFDASNWDYGLLDQLVFKKPALPLVLTARS